MKCYINYFPGLKWLFFIEFEGKIKKNGDKICIYSSKTNREVEVKEIKNTNKVKYLFALQPFLIGLLFYVFGNYYALKLGINIFNLILNTTMWIIMIYLYENFFKNIIKNFLFFFILILMISILIGPIVFQMKKYLDILVIESYYCISFFYFYIAIKEFSFAKFIFFKTIDGKFLIKCKKKENK